MVTKETSFFRFRMHLLERKTLKTMFALNTFRKQMKLHRQSRILVRDSLIMYLLIQSYEQHNSLFGEWKTESLNVNRKKKLWFGNKIN